MIKCLSCNQEFPPSNFSHRTARWGDRPYAFWCIKCREDPALWERANSLVHSVPEIQEAAIREILRRAERNVNGRECNLTVSDLWGLPVCCPILGMKLDYRARLWAIMQKVRKPCPRSDNAASLDRIDNNLGYVRGNVIVVSNRANTLKNAASLDELKQITEFYEKRVDSI